MTNQKEFKYQNMKIIYENRRGEYVINIFDSYFYFYRDWWSNSILFKTNSKLINNNYNLNRDYIHINNNFSSILDKKHNKRGILMPKLKTSTIIKRFIKKNWGLIVGLLLLLLFYYLVFKK